MNDVPFTKIALVEQNDTEFIYRCPFCGDSEKSYHGHLYISKKWPVFNCFRCGAKGNIMQIERFIAEPCRIDYNNTVKYDLPKFSAKETLENVNDLILSMADFVSTPELEYFRERVGLSSEMTNDDIVTYSLIPDAWARSEMYGNCSKALRSDDPLRVWTMRVFGSGISGRATVPDSGIMRYYNCNLSFDWNMFTHADIYVIRSSCIRKFDRANPPKVLVVAEGIYDIASIYTNRRTFMLDDGAMYSAVQCSDYRRAIRVFHKIYGHKPKTLVVFADIDRTKGMFDTMFKQVMKRTAIRVNWPARQKDWNPICPIGASIRYRPTLG